MLNQNQVDKLEYLYTLCLEDKIIVDDLLTYLGNDILPNLKYKEPRVTNINNNQGINQYGWIVFTSKESLKKAIRSLDKLKDPLDTIYSIAYSLFSYEGDATEILLEMFYLQVLPDFKLEYKKYLLALAKQILTKADKNMLSTYFKSLRYKLEPDYQQLIIDYLAS